MTRVQHEAFLLETDEPEAVAAVRHALTAAGIPYTLRPASVAHPGESLFVPWPRLDEAREIARQCLDDGWDDDDAAYVEDPRSQPARFPWPATRLVAGLVGLHTLIAWIGTTPAGDGWLRRGGLVAGAVAAEPWRLVTSLFLHVDVRHALWNGVPLLVFAVPLLAWLGAGRTALLYLTSGVGGALCATWFAEPRSVVVGSSGAIAGLFAAWVVLTLARSRYARLTWRARIRASGIALLVLPSFLSPMSDTGRPLSVASHVGGMCAGMLVGALLSSALWRREGGSLADGPGHSAESVDRWVN